MISKIANVGAEARTQVIRKIETRRTRLPDIFQIFIALGQLARVNHLALREKHQFIEERYYVTARLMNGEHYRAVIIPGKGHQTVDDAEGIVRVEATRRFIEEEDRRTSD